MARKKGASAASAARQQQQQQPRGWAVPAGVVAVVAVAASVVAARSSAHAIVEEDACDGDDATCWTARTAPPRATTARPRPRSARSARSTATTASPGSGSAGPRSRSATSRPRSAFDAPRGRRRRLFADDDLEARTVASRDAQLRLDRSRADARRRASRAPGPPRAIPSVRWEDVPAGGLDAASTPWIVEGYDARRNFTLDALAAACGAELVRPRRRVAGSSAWAGMEDGAAVPFGDFLAAEPADAVLFDVPLGTGCPALLEAVGVPHFAARALTSYGPSVFVSFGGGGGGLHVDSGATHFWQHVHSGAKSYRVFEAGAWPALFPADDDWRRAFFRDARCSGIFGEAAAAAASCDDGFGAAPVDAFADGAAGAAWAGEARAGDVVFVPANFPHQVRNADAVTVAVSMNYVDDTNLALVSEALLQAPAYHPKWLARLNVGGAAVAGSRAPWYARQRIAVPSDGEVALRARRGAAAAARGTGPWATS
ncbi:hypothetical protein JL721_160 [Aureococcus anophagefferens]|nr:hypothetical protein JL721_160 [Aureococcus anophagefferens]